MTSLNEDEDLDSLEATLRAQLEVVRLKKLEQAKFKPILVSNFILEPSNGSISFEISDYRDDVVEAIKSYRQWNPTNRLNYANYSQLDNILNALRPLKNVTIDITEENANLIRTWVPLPDVEISLNGFEDFVFKYNKWNAKYVAERIRGARHQTLKSAWIVPKSRALELWNAVQQNIHISVRWDPKALDICEHVVDRVKSLNEIAQKTESNLPEVDQVLNGHHLMPFQAITVEFAEATNGRMIIQHEMGLGKTPCALAYAEWLRRKVEAEGKKFVCVCIVPAMAKPNWSVQIKKFTNQYPTKISGSMPGPHITESMYLRKDNYYLINYDPISDSYVDEIKKHIDPSTGMEVQEKITGSTWVKLLNLVQPDLYIIDEAHYLKNSSSKRSQAIMDLDTEGRGILLLTGTSITNRPNDLHTLLHLIDKDVAGSRESFVNRYFDRATGVKNSAELREILKPIAFRKTKKEVLTSLEPIRRITKEYEISDGARKRYQLVLDGVFETLEKWDGSPKNTQLVTSILTMLLRCKQVLAQDKLLYTVDLAKEIIEGADQDDPYNKVIIFSQFVNEPAPVCRDIHRELGEESLLVIGDDSPEKRFDIIEQFQSDPTKKYLTCSIHAASESLNITAAGHVIFNDLVWTPATHHQAEGRAYGRLNDPHSVDAYYIVCPGTIEDQIWELLERKLRIFKEIIEDAEAERDPSIAMSILQMLREVRKMN